MPLAEKVIAKPLSGVEVIEAILHNLRVACAKQAPRLSHKIVDEFQTRLRANMKRDCYLNPIIAYSVYSSETTATFNFQEKEPGFFEVRSVTKIQFPATGTNIKETHIYCNTNMGEPVDGKDIEQAEVIARDTPRAPNAVRVETQQDIHVRTQTPQGRIQEKTMKYAGKPKSAATA